MKVPLTPEELVRIEEARALRDKAAAAINRAANGLISWIECRDCECAGILQNVRRRAAGTAGEGVRWQGWDYNLEGLWTCSGCREERRAQRRKKHQRNWRLMFQEVQRLRRISTPPTLPEQAALQINGGRHRFQYGRRVLKRRTSDGQFEAKMWVK